MFSIVQDKFRKGPSICHPPLVIYESCKAVAKSDVLVMKQQLMYLLETHVVMRSLNSSAYVVRRSFQVLYRAHLIEKTGCPPISPVLIYEYPMKFFQYKSAIAWKLWSVKIQAMKEDVVTGCFR